MIEDDNAPRIDSMTLYFSRPGVKKYKRPEFGDVVVDKHGMKWTCVPERIGGMRVSRHGRDSFMWEDENGIQVGSKPRAPKPVTTKKK